MSWSLATLNKINQADDLKIAPERADGKTGTPTWIWEVIVDGRLFVRAYFGKQSSWYQSAIAYKQGIINAAGQTFDVRFSPIADRTLNDKIDDAYRQKYSKSQYMRHMIQAGCREATVEILLAA
ncbi:hypothetical protein A1D23_05880 [Chelonobacter oris]|uniref:DUF2255 family protein n=1 Tax=Chelonobacter oris TaxID=505317 RepID=A0A0A3ALD6_9PAST|nr:DUF2255 family protein [Chelonobacter oris]KGQ70168.1 hypothetical protein OA57_07495 [Chelonobacter oris]MDH2999621.1 hypothetical protein [Chelonobacter oris]